MNRSPFANYDSWLEQPYQDACDAADQAEWIAENSTYTTACCDAPVKYEFVIEAKNGELSTQCPTCMEAAHVIRTEPTKYDDGDEYDDGEYDR